MKIAIETPEKLTDTDLDAIISIWKRKPRGYCTVYNCISPLTFKFVQNL